MDKMVETYLHNTYSEIDVLKSSVKSKIVLAFNQISKQVCAIKYLQNNTNYTLYKQLQEIEHHILPQIYYVYQDDDMLLVIEEYINGQSLAEYLSVQKVIPDNEIEDILLQLCKGLAMLHRLRIIHRDIKLENIMITTDRIVKLIDFDIARTFKEDEAHDTTYLGTKGYAAPEQYGYSQTDVRSDIYALGATLKRLNPESERLKHIVNKSMQIDPKNRYQSVEEIMEELEGAYSTKSLDEKDVLDKFEIMLHQKLELFRIPEPVQARDYPYIKEDYFLMMPPSRIDMMDYQSEDEAKKAGLAEFNRLMFCKLNDYIKTVLDDYRLSKMVHYYAYQREKENFYYKINMQIERIISDVIDYFDLKIPDYVKHFECIPSYTLFSGNEDKKNFHLWRIKHLQETEYVDEIRTASFDRIMSDGADGFEAYINVESEPTTQKKKKWFRNEYEYTEVMVYNFNLDEVSEVFSENILQSVYLIMFNNKHLQEDIRGLITKSYTPEFKRLLAEKIEQIMDFLKNKSK